MIDIKFSVLQYEKYFIVFIHNEGGSGPERAFLYL